MDRIGIIYGSTSGTTAHVAEMIRAELGRRAVGLHDVAEVNREDLEAYDVLILGTSTLGCGELQDDWERFRSEFLALDLRGKRVALFGLGDQSEFCNTFVDGLGSLHAMAVEVGAWVVGFWDAIDEYEFGKSAAEVGGKFVGLVIDEENQPELTAGRVRKWGAQLKKELTLSSRGTQPSRSRTGGKKAHSSVRGSR